MTVLNKYKDGATPNSVYIGRGSIWGNPFIIGKHGTREEVIQKYHDHLIFKLEHEVISIEMLASLHGKDLVCFCAPLPCHGDIIESAAEWAVTELASQNKDLEQ